MQFNAAYDKTASTFIPFPKKTDIYIVTHMSFARQGLNKHVQTNTTVGAVFYMLS
jgi:hypothetical protein